MKVKIIKCGKLGWWYANKIGEVFEIYYEHVNSNCYITGDGIGININDCKIIEYDKMKKEDLKTGMLVKYFNGELRVVFNDILHKQNGNHANTLGDYTDDLIDRISKDCTIITIYQPKTYDALINFDLRNCTLLWQRKDEFEVTLKVNGIEMKPCTISQETWNKLRTQ